MGIRVRPTIKRITLIGLAFAYMTGLLFSFTPTPASALGLGMVRIKGTVTDAQPQFLPSVSVYLTAPGSSTVLYGPAVTTDYGIYQLDVIPGTYDIHFVPGTGGWFGGVNGDVKSNVSIQTSTTINDVLSYKSVSTPVIFADFRCGAVDLPGSRATFNIPGGYGFTPASSERTYIDGVFVSGGSPMASSGFSGGLVMDGAQIGTPSQITSSIFAPGQHTVTTTTSLGQTATTNFTVPSSCPLFDFDVTPSTADNNVVQGQPFPVTLYSTPTFSAPDRIDVSSLRFGIGEEHLYDGLPPKSCDTTTDVNGDGLPDLTCYVTLTGDSGDYMVAMTGRTLDEGSSPDGFKFIRVASVLLGIEINITNSGESQPHLTWNGISGVDHYNVYRDNQLIGTSTTAEYTDTSLTGAGDYFYQVVPQMSDGSTGELSEPAEDIIDASAFLTSPTGLTAVTPTNNAPVLTWNAEASAASYQVYRQDTNTNTTVLAGTSTTNNFTDVYAPGIYNYTVVAVGSGGSTSAPSSALQVVVTNTTATNSRNMLAQGQTEVMPIAGTDSLPGLTSGSNTKASFDFNVGYPGGVFTVKRPFTFTYNAAGHTFFVNSTSADWLVVDGTNSSRGTFQGMANVNVDGTTQNLPFSVTATDGALLTPGTTDDFNLTVYADSNRTTVLYSVHETLSKGNIKIN